MTDFEPAEQLWVDRFANLRNVIRQEMIGRQLASAVTTPGSVLDVGCGQGEQLLRLMDAGWTATGFDKSIDLLELFQQSAADRGHRPQTVTGTFDQLAETLDGQSFDLVCAHGLLMYLPDCRTAVNALAGRVAPGGHLSITVRNGDGLAWRHGLRHDWQAALAAFNNTAYVNDLGLPAQAHRLADVQEHLVQAGMELTAWFGVRVFHEGTAPEAQVPDAPTLAALLDVEEQAGAQDPYRHLGGQLHLIARHRSS